MSLSVIIPIHNQAIYLERVLSSVLWQLSPFDECIVVDDGSTDGLHRFLTDEHRRRVLLLKLPESKGVSAARNIAITRARGDWIKLLDADDYLAPYILDAFRAMLESVPDHVHILSGGITRVINGLVADYVQCSSHSLKDILFRNPMLPSATFIRRSALLEIGLFDERIDFEEDWDLWLRMYRRFTLDGFGAIDRSVCYYWINSLERSFKGRRYTVEGVPVREYFAKQYGCQADEWF